jgi:3-methylfumaryl-CoA hydratase
MTATATATLDLDHLRKWIGKTSETSDLITSQMVRGLRATFFLDIGNPVAGDPAPAAIHWCLAPQVAPMSEIGPDGHPARGGFLPPVPLPRRMWAGGKTDFIDPLRVGDEVQKVSKIVDVQLKSGSTGTLCFVTLDHTFSTRRGKAVFERQDVVYRDNPPPGGNKTSTSPVATSAPKPQYQKTLKADPVLLFRYSALTFNGHRIHYDRPYVTGVEGYPGLIVHGPLQASLLIEYAISLRGKSPKTFTHRGVSPLFDDGSFTVNANEMSGGGLELWTANAAGAPTMKANASW